MSHTDVHAALHGLNVYGTRAIYEIQARQKEIDSLISKSNSLVNQQKQNQSQAGTYANQATAPIGDDPIVAAMQASVIGGIAGASGGAALGPAGALIGGAAGFVGQLVYMATPKVARIIIEIIGKKTDCAHPGAVLLDTCSEELTTALANPQDAWSYDDNGAFVGAVESLGSNVLVQKLGKAFEAIATQHDYGLETTGVWQLFDGDKHQTLFEYMFAAHLCSWLVTQLALVRSPSLATQQFARMNNNFRSLATGMPTGMIDSIPVIGKLPFVTTGLKTLTIIAVYNRNMFIFTHDYSKLTAIPGKTIITNAIDRARPALQSCDDGMTLLCGFNSAKAIAGTSLDTITTAAATVSTTDTPSNMNPDTIRNLNLVAKSGVLKIPGFVVDVTVATMEMMGFSTSKMSVISDGVSAITGWNELKINVHRLHVAKNNFEGQFTQSNPEVNALAFTAAGTGAAFTRAVCDQTNVPYIETAPPLQLAGPTTRTSLFDDTITLPPITKSATPGFPKQNNPDLSQMMQAYDNFIDTSPGKAKAFRSTVVVGLTLLLNGGSNNYRIADLTSSAQCETHFDDVYKAWAKHKPIPLPSVTFFKRLQINVQRYGNFLETMQSDTCNLTPENVAKTAENIAENITAMKDDVVSDGSAALQSVEYSVKALMFIYYAYTYILSILPYLALAPVLILIKCFAYFFKPVIKKIARSATPALAAIESDTLPTLTTETPLMYRTYKFKL